MKLSLRHPRPTRTATIAIASAAAGIALAVPGLAVATHSGQSVPAPPANPTSASQIQNIDQVKTAISAYYGDTPTGTLAPGDPTKTLHQPSPDGAYAHEVEGIAADAGKFLAHEAKPQQKHSAAPAIVFDIDDTTLNTYSYEIFSGFVFNGTTNGNFVNAGSADVFPAVPGMVDLEAKAMDEGYTVFFLTGRPETQRAADRGQPRRRRLQLRRRQRLPEGQRQPLAVELRAHVHPDAVQVPDQAAHRVARLPHRGQPG